MKHWEKDKRNSQELDRGKAIGKKTGGLSHPVNEGILATEEIWEMGKTVREGRSWERRVKKLEDHVLRQRTWRNLSKRIGRGNVGK